MVGHLGPIGGASVVRGADRSGDHCEALFLVSAHGFRPSALVDESAFRAAHPGLFRLRVWRPSADYSQSVADEPVAALPVPAEEVVRQSVGLAQVMPDARAALRARVWVQLRALPKREQPLAWRQASAQRARVQRAGERASQPVPTSEHA
jgi:hypothetical protein